MTKKRDLMLMKAKNFIYQNHSSSYFRRNKSSISSQAFTSFTIQLKTKVFQLSDIADILSFSMKLMLLVFATYYLAQSDGYPNPYEMMSAEDRAQTCPGIYPGNQK